MKLRRSIQYMLLLVCIAGIAFVWTQADAHSGHKAVPGKAAPLFTLMDLQGEQIELANYKGKGVLLNFWASWCNPCVNELPLFNEAYKLTGVEMLAINVGEKAETVQKFADRYELAFPIALDVDMQVKQRYGVVGLPLTVLVDEHGNLLERHEGELTEMADILQLMKRIQPDEQVR